MPKAIRCAATLSFDVDGEAGMLQGDPKNKDRIAVLSWARYGPKVGVPRILDMPKEKEVKAIFFATHPEIIDRPARVIMLERLIDYLRSQDGVWLTTCEDIARHQSAKQTTVEKVIA